MPKGGSVKKDKLNAENISDQENNPKSNIPTSEIFYSSEDLVTDSTASPASTDEIKPPKRKTPPPETKVALDDFMEDVRESIKDSTLIDSSTQILPDSAYQREQKRPEFLKKFDKFMSEKVKVPYISIKKPKGAKKTKKKRSPIRFIIFILLIAILIYTVFFFGRFFIQNQPKVIPTFTIVPTFSIPIPATVELPGGWKIDLVSNDSKFEEWIPTKAEWLSGTLICKLVALPWSKQLSAVYSTFEIDEPVILKMTNEDLKPYKISEIDSIARLKIPDLIDTDSPCMVIYLYKENEGIFQYFKSEPVK